MSLQFRGNYARLQKYASRIDANGEWRDLKYNGKQYRTAQGAVLNWWKKRGTILFQGHGAGAKKFQMELVALAFGENRLELKDAKDVQNTREEDVTLQSVIDELLIENRRLKRRLSKR
jgi:hypothetical protein